MAGHGIGLSILGFLAEAIALAYRSFAGWTHSGCI